MTSAAASGKLIRTIPRGLNAIIGSLGVGLDGNGDLTGGDNDVLNSARILAGDYNGDGVVNAVDISLVRALMVANSYDLRADFDYSGTVDAGDLSYVRARVGTFLAPPAGGGGIPIGGGFIGANPMTILGTHQTDSLTSVGDLDTLP